jgi:hypothetical protein
MVLAIERAGAAFSQAFDFPCLQGARFRGNVCSAELLSGQGRRLADNAISGAVLGEINSLQELA